jgi:transposase
LLAALGIASDRETVLRRVKQRASVRTEAVVRVLGVDDWVWRKGLRYGTMLMDLERRRVVDLLPDRSTQSFAQWLQQHPGAEIITRNRCGLYAAAGRQATASAVQIADRYHLLSNLSEAVQRDVQRLQIESRGDPPPTPCLQAKSPKGSH